MNDCAKSIARIALDIGAIKLSPQDPFTWASGYRNPIYNDNRLLLCDFEYRSLVTGGFEELVRREHIPFEVIAGTATAGVPWATSLADRLKMPLVYVREKPKTHGAGKQVEGVLKPGQKVLLVEDLISTGKSSGAAAEAIRREGGVVNAIVSIFTYELQEAAGCFTGLKP
jgi:orotate phosphoribosyltransferase